MFIFTFSLIESSGFVYGSMNFLEKIGIGAIFILLQKLMPVLPHVIVDSVSYFKWIFTLGVGGLYLCGFLCAGLLMIPKIGKMSIRRVNPVT